MLYNMENKIRHIGIVESINGECVKVRIVQSSACSSCKAAKQCHTSESKEKIVDVFLNDSKEYVNGQKVLVITSYGIGLYAVFLAMLIPLAILTVTLFVTSAAGYSELTAALAALFSLIPYYIILLFFRKKINRKVTFSLEKLDEQ